jgi:hypothetical protein
MDIGAITRLRYAIEATIRMQPTVSSADALGTAAQDFRERALSLLDPALKDEFEEMFPPLRESGPDLLESAAGARTAHARLLGMHGWLEGLEKTQSR